jgi:hypothetical protein
MEVIVQTKAVKPLVLEGLLASVPADHADQKDLAEATG